MIGAEPPQLQHREARAGAVVLEVREPVAGEAGPVRHRLEDIALRGARRRDRRHRRRLGQRPAGADGGAVGRRRARAARARSACSAPTSRARRRAGAAARACTSCRKSGSAAARCRRCRWRRTRCSRAPSTVGRGGWLRIGAVRSARRAADRALQRQGRRARARRRRACRAATCRSSSSAARSMRSPKLLIVSQPTWGVDVGAAAQIRGELLDAARRRLRGAGRQRRARRAVRDQRPPGRDRRRAACRRACATREATIEMIGEWMSGLWPRQRSRSAALALEARSCSGSKRARSRRGDVDRLAAARAGDHGADRHRAVRAARQGPAARPRRVLRRADQERVRAGRSSRSRRRR